MRLAKRIAFIFLGIIILLGGLGLIFLTLGLFPKIGIQTYGFRWLEGSFNYTALGFLILVAGVLLIAFFSPGVKKREAGSIISFNEIGEIRLSFRAVEKMVLAASRKVKGIREVTTHIDMTEQGLVIYLRIKPIPDLPIPALGRQLQETVRDYVQEISGSSVAEVKVLVENISQDRI
jgi:uncharacterized alkaline shock family protein YloU